MNTRRHQLRGLLTAALIGLSTLAQASIGPAEKPDLKLGFIKLTDMAPLAVAWEQGYFLTKACSWNWRRRPTGKCCWTG